MNILLNFSTIKKGGGQNVALNFLESLERIELKEDIKINYAVVKDSEIHKYLINNKKQPILLMPSNPIKRMIKEAFLGSKVLKKNKIDLIYTYFGIGLFDKNILQVSGSADSNIYFPEINFWKDYKGWKRFKHYLVDQYRIWGLKRMKAIIFENKIMEERGKELFGLEKTIFIKPSINLNFENNEFEPLKGLNSVVPRGLFLCGWHRNKNVFLIPEIAAKLKKNNIDFHFVLTAPNDNSNDHLEFNRLMKDFDVEDMITITGSVKKEELESLYNQIDVVFLLSKLESFSNNIIESWNFNKPLVTSDELWAHSICKDAAYYVDRDNVSSIVKTIYEIITNPEKKNKIIDAGKNLLYSYPKIEEKTKQEINYLLQLYDEIN